MKSGVLILLLAASLLFNVFFAAGFMRARAEARRALAVPDLEAVHVARELNLDDAQRAAFEQLRASTREEQAAFADSLALTRQELVDELNREQPDLEKVRTLITRETELIAQRRLAETGRFSAFVGLLNPEQCRKLSQRLGGRGFWDGRPGPGGPGSESGSGPDGRPRGGPDRDHRDGGGRQEFLERMRRFDVNKDGQLDETERAEARKAFEERIREDRERREATFNKFDADQDGKLDRQELDQMNRYMFEKWRDRPRGGSGRPPMGPPSSEPNQPAQPPATVPQADSSV